MATIIKKAKKLQIRSLLDIRTESGEGRFTLIVLQPDPSLASLAVRLLKDNGDAYDIHKSLDGRLHCDCPDGTFRSERPGGCKHIRAVRHQIALFSALSGMLSGATGTAAS